MRFIIWRSSLLGEDNILKVFQVSSRLDDFDLSYMTTDNQYEADDNDLLWYFAISKFDEHVKLVYVQSPYEADLKVWRVFSKYDLEFKNEKAKKVMKEKREYGRKTFLKLMNPDYDEKKGEGEGEVKGEKVVKKKVPKKKVPKKVKDSPIKSPRRKKKRKGDSDKKKKKTPKKESKKRGLFGRKKR